MPMFHDGRTVASPSSLYRHTSPRSGIIQERRTARTKCRGIGMRRGFGARQRGPCAIYQNDDWGTTANANQMVSTAERIGAASLRSGWQDAALLLTLPPGVYSAIVSGSANTTGVWNGRSLNAINQNIVVTSPRGLASVSERRYLERSRACSMRSISAGSSLNPSSRAIAPIVS